MTPTPKVIDLYHGDTVISFDEVYSSGIRGVIHKATEGETVIDPLYTSRKLSASRTPLLWGAYHFWRPDPVKAQAQHFLSVAKGAPLLALDYEVAGGTIAELVMFIQIVEGATGRAMVVYGNEEYLGEQIVHASDHSVAFLKARRLWWAEYKVKRPSLPLSDWELFLWQYTGTGEAPGTRGHVDLNSFDGSDEDLAKQWSGG